MQSKKALRVHHFEAKCKKMEYSMKALDQPRNSRLLKSQIQIFQKNKNETQYDMYEQISI